MHDIECSVAMLSKRQRLIIQTTLLTKAINTHLGATFCSNFAQRNNKTASKKNVDSSQLAIDCVSLSDLSEYKTFKGFLYEGHPYL